MIEIILYILGLILFFFFMILFCVFNDWYLTKIGVTEEQKQDFVKSMDEFLYGDLHP